MKLYEQDKSAWKDDKVKLEKSIEQEQFRHRQRVPFDPFASTQQRIMNVTKADGKTREKQVEIVTTLKEFANPGSKTSLSHGFESLFKALKDQLDGSMPVFNEFGEGEQDSQIDQNSSNNPGVKKFTIYIERVSNLQIFIRCLINHIVDPRPNW